MAKHTKLDSRARELYWESGEGERNWNDLSDDEKAPWLAKASTDQENPPVTPVALGVDKPTAPKIPVPVIIRDPLAAYRQAEGSIKIEVPAPNRYVITGFRVAAVFIPNVGTLAAPDQIDLPLNDDTAPAVQAALDDYNARKGWSVIDTGKTHSLTEYQQGVLHETVRVELEIANVRQLIGSDPDGKIRAERYADLLWAKRRVLTQYLGLLEQEVTFF